MPEDQSHTAIDFADDDDDDEKRRYLFWRNNYWRSSGNYAHDSYDQINDHYSIKNRYQSRDRTFASTSYDSTRIETDQQKTRHQSCDDAYFMWNQRFRNESTR